MSWEKLLGYMFSPLFTQHKVAKENIFTTAIQENKLNPAIYIIALKKTVFYITHLKILGWATNYLSYFEKKKTLCICIIYRLHIKLS